MGGTNGIPYVVVPGTQARVAVRFRYPDESDPGPYPIPPDAPIEGGRRRKATAMSWWSIAITESSTSCSARTGPGGKGWSAGSGAVFDLKSNRVRPAGGP